MRSTKIAAGSVVLALISGGAALVATPALGATTVTLATVGLPPNCTNYTLERAYSITSTAILIAATVTGPLQISGLIPGDGVEQVERSPQGLEVSLVSPPEGFKPSNASAAQLAIYGIPTRPTDPSAAADWDTYWDRPLFGTPYEVCSLPSAQTLLQPDAAPAVRSLSKTASDAIPAVAPSTGSNWSGALIRQSGNFYGAVGSFTRPAYLVCTQGGSKHASWVGLGGTSGQALWQVGTDLNTSTQTNYPFYEVVRGGTSGTDTHGEVPLSSVQVGVGVAYHFTITAATPGQAVGNDIAMGVENTQTGQYFAGHFTSTSQIPFSPTTAEWIDERPAGGPVDGAFYYFSGINNSSRAAQWGGERYNGSTPRANMATQELIMDNHRSGTTTPLGDMTILNDTATQDNWYRCY